METISHYRGYVLLTLLFSILFGSYVLYDRLPRPEPLEIIQPTPAPTPTEGPIRVHVTGAVHRPGVYDLPAGSRLIEAVEAAGGMTVEADGERINLADHISDGQQVFVPRRDTPIPPSPTPMNVAAAADRSGSMGVLVNINTASVAELETLPGIGPTYAERIVAYREMHGPFEEPAQIMNVKGIGPACYERIKTMISVR